MTATTCETPVRARPTFGMSFGQSGYWGNRHFATESLARAAYQSYVAETRKIYATPGRQWTGRYVEEAIPAGSMLVEGVRFVPLNKDGRRGSRIHTVHLYQIEDKMADRFLADPWYSCESSPRVR